MASPSAVTATPTPLAGQSPTAVPTATPDVALLGTGRIQGTTFVDDNANGQLTDAKQRMTGVELVLTFANGLSRTTHSDPNGDFHFDGLQPGSYHVAMTSPPDYVPTTDAGHDVEIADGVETPYLTFGLITREAAGLPPEGAAPDAASDDEQIIALASVTSLPLRFAEGRDLMAQLQRRVLGDGLIWLGVPFRSQLDGGDFQYVNCGPASLTMVLAGFGLDVGPSQVRDYLNSMIDNFNTDLGTSLDVLARIATQAGLTPMDLYSDQGGYRNWSTDAVRWHVQQGHPVITLVKYRNLPGHTSSLSEFDHYIVITGLTPNGFIYNDGAFATTLGYGLEISDVELEYAWDNSSIPHHALALGLAPDQKSLTFPELPRKPRSIPTEVVARGARRLAEADAGAVGRAPLVLTPVVAVAAPPVAASPGPVSLVGDGWADDPALNVSPPPDPGTPMGLNLDPTEQPTLEATPGPGAEVPKLLALLGGGWLLWGVAWLSGVSAQRLNAIRWPRPRLPRWRARS
ncbi:MAG: C39 family peptidase [Chloroflexi bacterium]|nr:C39 family peptidase [Chloroflexota bacterium]MBV9600619.1 C39 family peptidase [Chloroflexota bacterium]